MESLILVLQFLNGDPAYIVHFEGINLVLPQCQYEDSANCFWNAHTQGNGVGQSFFNVDGIYIYETEWSE